MGFTLISSSGNLIGTQGQLLSVTCTVKSTDMLVGKVIRVSPAMWLSSSDSPSNVSYQITYPASTPVGGIPMTYVGLPVNENLHAYIEVVDAYTFKIIYTFISLSDLNDFLNDTSYNNNDVLSSTSISGKDLVLEIEEATTGMAIQVMFESYINGFNQDLGLNVSGFDPNNDLDICLTSPIQAIDNLWYVGWVEVSSITSAQNFVNDFDLNLAHVQNGVTAVDSMIPITSLENGTGFSFNGTESKSTITIKSSDLDSSKCYRLYAVYKENGEWQSYLSPPLKAIVPDRPQISGDISTEITDVFGNVHTGGCLSGVSNCGTVKVCGSMDIASFDANLAAEGLTGTFSDYYQSAKMYVGQADPQDGYIGQLTPSVVDLNATSIEACVNINDDTLTGQYYYTLQIKTIIQGVADYTNIVMPISFVSTVESPITVSLSGNEVDRLCIEESNYNLDIDTNCTLLASVNGGNYRSPLYITNGVLNASSLSEGDDVCIKLLCEGTPTTVECDCPPCEEKIVEVAINSFENTFAISATQTSGDLGLITLDIQHNNGNTQLSGVGVIPSTGLNCSDTVVPVCGINFSVNIEGDDGCLYQEEFSTVILDGTPIVQNFTLEPTTEFQDCDCDDIVPIDQDDCVNNAWFEFTCDEETGDIVATANQSFGSPVDVDTTSTLTGNGTLTVTRSTSFTDHCEDINITETFVCEVVKVCDNSLTIAYTNVDGLITLTETESFESGIASDTLLEYSIDGGVTYQQYSTPVTLADGETIIWSRQAIFDDACPDINRSGSFTYTEEEAVDPTEDCNDYSSYGLTVVSDDDNSTFTVTPTGDQSSLITNELLWSGIGIDPFDTNGSGVPYLSPVNMRGSFIAAWKIQVAGCPEYILYAQSFLKPEVKVCELPKIEFNANSLPIKVCITDCDECGCTFEVDCINCMATLTGLDGCDGFTFEWYHPDGTLIGTGVGPIELTDEGNYTIKAIGDDCEENFTYFHDEPDAGEPVANPIVLQ